MMCWIIHQEYSHTFCSPWTSVQNGKKSYDAGVTSKKNIFENIALSCIVTKSIARCRSDPLGNTVFKQMTSLCSLAAKYLELKRRQVHHHLVQSIIQSRVNIAQILSQCLSITGFLTVLFFLFFFVLTLSLQLIWPVVVAGLREWIDPRLVNKAIIRSRLSLCLCTDSTLDGVNAAGRRGAREGRTLMVRFNILMRVGWICLNQFQWWETLALFWFCFHT